MASKTKRSGFSLIELMVSAAIVLIVATAGLMSVVVMNRSSRAALDRTRAESLLERSRADVGRMTASFFDSIQKCQFPENVSGEQNTCGLEEMDDLPPEYAGFAREMDVVIDNPELKTVVLRVTWNDRGMPRSAENIFKVARPSEALPGNIIGCLKDSKTGTLIKGAVITALPAEGASGIPVQTLSSEEPLFDDKNFSFAEEVTGAFTLNTGLWSLKATHDEYLDYVYEDGGGNPKTVAVMSGKSTTLPDCLEMQPIPGSSYLTIKVFRVMPDGTWIHSPMNNVEAGVYARFTGIDDAGVMGTHEDGIKDINTPVEWTIEFPVEMIAANGGEICATVFTRNTFRYRLVGEQTCRAGLTRERDGWSSAQAKYGCDADWNGDNMPRDVCIGYDEEVVVDIPLVQLPTLTVQGWIEAADGNPVSGFWPTSAPTEINMTTKVYDDAGWAGTSNKCYYSTHDPAKKPCIIQNSSGSVVAPPVWDSTSTNRFFHSCEQITQYFYGCKQINEPGINYRFNGVAMGEIFRDDECPAYPNPGWGTCNGTLHACGQVVVDGCCGEKQTHNVSVCTEEFVFRPSQLKEGGVLTQNFVLPVEPTVCGNLDGTIQNHLGAPLAGAKAWAKWVMTAQTTNDAGYYQYWCGEGSPDFRIPIDMNYILHAEASGYYTYDSNSAVSKYSYRMIKPPAIPADGTLNYPLITLLNRRSTGTITFVVTNANNGNPISNAKVEVKQYQGATSSCTTNSSGVCSISGMLETWPPKRLRDNPSLDPGMPAGYERLTNCWGGDVLGTNSYFCYSSRRHNVTVSRSGFVTRTVSSGILDEVTPKTIPIPLTPSGGGPSGT